MRKNAIRCHECDNGIDTKWSFCPWCGFHLVRSYFNIIADGSKRFVLVDERDDSPDPVFSTMQEAEVALEVRVAEAYEP